MRPKLLEIEGLQSFTDVQRIDFEPLGETGLFGIFGPTGSGKSTILDAITFALYGKVKRAENGTQGIINSNRNTARVSFSFELIRDGKRKTYRVERTYQRKKNSQNSCEPKIARLIEVMDSGEIPLCDKATEVSNQVRDLLGLNHDDFTRAVVLPQNSFQEFLLLNNKDRRGMLERIFYLEDYGQRLEDKIKRKMAVMKSRLDVFTGELKGYADASDEALEEAKKTMEMAVVERNRVEKELKQLEARFHEAREVWGLVQELTEFNRKEQQHNAVKDSVEEKRNRLEKAVKADGLQELILNNKELYKSLNETDIQLSKVMEALPELHDKLGETIINYESLKKESVSEQPKLVGRKAGLVAARITKSEIISISERIALIQNKSSQLKIAESELNQKISSETAEFEILEKELERVRKEMEPLQVDPEYRQHVQEGVKLENEVVSLSNNVKELEARRKTLEGAAAILAQKLKQSQEELARSLQLQEEIGVERQKLENTKPGDKNSVMKFIEKIHLVQGIYDMLKLRQRELDQLQQKSEQLHTNIGQLEQKVHMLEGIEKNTGKEYDESKAAYENAVKALNRNSAYMLSKSLQEGNPCPVCGSLDHPDPAAHEDIKDIVLLEMGAEKEKIKLNESEKAFRNAERKTLVTVEQLKTVSGQHLQLLQDMEQKKAEYDLEKQKLPDKLKDLNLEQLWMEIEKANTSYNEKLQSLEQWEVQLEGLKERLQIQNDRIAVQRLAENGIVTELKVNRDHQAQLVLEYEKSSKLLNVLSQSYSEFLETYKIEGAGNELKRLTENDRNHNLLQKESERYQAEAGKKRLSLEHLRDEVGKVHADRIRQESEEKSLLEQNAEKQNQLRELAGDADIDEEIKRIEERLEGYTKKDEEIRKNLVELEGRYNELITQKSLFENQRSIYSGNLKKEELRLKAALEEKGFIDRAEVENALLSTDLQKEIRIEIQEFDREMINIQAHKSLLQKKLNSRSITEEEWNLTNLTFTEQSAYKEECVSHSEVARNNYKNLNRKHDKWVELCKTYNELNHKQGLYDQIHKLIKGELRRDNSFIDYIAEERLRYVAANASLTLGVLTKHRYVLELDTEAGFIIRDQANGGIHRMVSSLSGGETFLTSLSLALSLSEQIQLKGQSPLEFFFLDEGFGTLDQDLLDTVIDSLERLSSNERVIGLISHVPELKGRIGRRLIVEPPSLQGEGSRVVIEKA